MAITVIHVVTDLSQINFGVWNASLFGSGYLKSKYGIRSCLLACEDQHTDVSTVSVPVIWAGRRPSAMSVIEKLSGKGLTSADTVVVTHGCWHSPSRLGYHLKQKGFRWVYTPHGMLEPWSLANYRLKKIIYFHLFEKRYSRKADFVRAVSKNEQSNLKKLLNGKVEVIENGAKIPVQQKKEDGEIKFLFMARLHFKKGVTPLVKAWSKTMKDSRAKLIIAGPDEGELGEIKPLVNGNMEYVGAVYGDDKIKLLQQSHYYLLPSQSEGFPTSVVEAMSYGVIPIISAGCNFPEVFDESLGYRVEPDEKDIARQLVDLKGKSFDHELSDCNHKFIAENYSESVIGEKLYSIYGNLI